MNGIKKQIQFLLETLMVLLAAVSVRGALYTETFSSKRPVRTILNGKPAGVKTRDAFGNDSTVGLGATVTVNPTFSPGAGPLADTTQLNLGTAILSDLQVNQAENYDVLTEAFDVVKWTWTVTATGANKTYDGTTTARVTWLDNKVSGDAVKDSYTSAGFSGKTSGMDAGNYNLQSITTTASTSANVTRLAVIWPDRRTYDGTKATARQPIIHSTDTATGSQTYDGTTAATAAILKSGNNLDGAKLTLSGSGPLADKNAGSQTISAGPLAPGKLSVPKTATFSGGPIPDGNPVGVTFGGTVSGTLPSGGIVGGLTVSLNISGGFNGDLYAYLVAPDGTLVVLLNQPGVSGDSFGASGAGMNIILQDRTSDHGSIQSETSGSVLSGSYNASGTLVNFNGSVADGTWTLFFADLSNGGTSRLDSWSLNIEAVPEPVNVALGIFGVLLGGLGLARYHAAKRRSVLQPQA